MNAIRTPRPVRRNIGRRATGSARSPCPRIVPLASTPPGPGKNFPLAGRPVHPALVRAYGEVKLACAVTNDRLGAWKDRALAEAIQTACREMAGGQLDDRVVVDALQGGAGTSLNMNVNEVIANRALELMELAPGSYNVISPLDDVKPAPVHQRHLSHCAQAGRHPTPP